SADTTPEAALHELQFLVLHLGEARGAGFQLDFPARHFSPRRDPCAARLQFVIEIAVLAANFADVVERAPVNGGRTELAYRALMLLRRIALVAGEAVTWIERIELGHQPVAIHLRKDGSRGDGEIDAVAF